MGNKPCVCIHPHLHCYPCSRTFLFQVSQQFAACILLPDNTKASLSAVSVLPKAKFVSVEPVSEEDWEVLELNSELAEVAILKQVTTCWLMHLNLSQVLSPDQHNNKTELNISFGEHKMNLYSGAWQYFFL
jgi:hypothetical protein